MLLFAIAFGYLCGSIPFGLLLARRAGVDVRRVGSGNIGATNVARSTSNRLGLATLALDAAKGAVPVALARWLANDQVAACAGLAAFLGHVFPLYLRFSGGKGVATALGVLLGLSAWLALAALAVFAVVLLACRYVSAASVAAGIAAAAVALVLFGWTEYGIAVIAIVALVIWRHRANVQRLRSGTEHKIFATRDALPPTDSAG